MNKYTKGAIATGAAIVLLLGGAGTFALWNDSADIAGGDIDSGTLELVNPTSGEWLDVSTVTPVAVPNINAFLIVPGDVLEYTQSFEIEASGNNLEATLDVFAEDFEDAAVLAGYDLNDLLVTVAVDGVAGPAELDETNDGDVIEVVVTVTFDEDADNDSQGLSVDLTSLDITLQQHR